MLGCDTRLFGLLSDAHQILADRYGWDMPVGMGTVVLDALGPAATQTW